MISAFYNKSRHPAAFVVSSNLLEDALTSITYYRKLTIQSE